MDETVTPERVKNILSSFLISSNKSPNETTSDDINTKQNGKESDTKITSSNSSTSALRSHSSFVQRLDTFSALTWFSKPVDVSPLICARYGWENVDVDMLQCVGCKAFLCGQLPAKSDFEAYEESYTKLKKNFLASHDKFCVLAAYPCPDNFCHVLLDDPTSLVNGFIERVKALTSIQNRLPSIDDTQLHVYNYDEGQGGAYCKRHLMPDHNVSPELATLAFTGWSFSGSSEDVLMCSMCRRKVGLWNFQSSVSHSLSQDTADEVENFQDKEDDPGDPPSKKRRSMPLHFKQKFDPIDEHNHWCPWIQPTAVSLIPTATPTSPSTKSNSSGSENVPAWIAALRTMAPGLMDNNMGLASAMKTSPMVEGLRCFRRVMKSWSSPKAQHVTSPQP